MLLDKDVAVKPKLGRDWSFVVMVGTRVHCDNRNKAYVKRYLNMLRAKGRSNVGLYKRNGDNFTFIE